MAALQKNEKFCSTRGHDSGSTGAPVEFTNVVQQGLAPDRGLYVPETQPTPFQLNELERLVDLNFQERYGHLLWFRLGQRCHGDSLVPTS